MSADFTSLDNDRANIANLFGYVTGFGTRVKNFMTRCFGASNPFGTASTLNAVTSKTSGAVPALDTDSDIARVQLPAATTSAKGAAIVGGASSPASGTLAGVSYPFGLSPVAARGILDPFTHAITASAFDINNIPTRNYGLSNALRTSLIIPRQACMIILSANGGLSSSSIARNGDGADIGIVDSTGRDILRINGGERGAYNRTFSDGRVDGDTVSTYNSTTSVNTLQTISQNILTELSLRAGILLKGMGASGSRAGSETRESLFFGSSTSTYRWTYSNAGDLFIGIKDETDNPITWLTDAPVPPPFIRSPTPAGVGIIGTPPSDSHIGFAFYIRLR